MADPVKLSLGEMAQQYYYDGKGKVQQANKKKTPTYAELREQIRKNYEEFKKIREENRQMMLSELELREKQIEAQKKEIEKQLEEMNKKDQEKEFTIMGLK